MSSSVPVSAMLLSKASSKRCPHHSGLLLAPCPTPGCPRCPPGAWPPRVDRRCLTPLRHPRPHLHKARRGTIGVNNSGEDGWSAACCSPAARRTGVSQWSLRPRRWELARRQACHTQLAHPGANTWSQGGGACGGPDGPSLEGGGYPGLHGETAAAGTVTPGWQRRLCA